jgi:hypothetical protein
LALPWWIGPGLLLLALFPALFVWMNTTPEPFVLAAGVSIWPAELLRVAAAVLSAIFIVVALRTLRASDRAIAEDFQLPTQYCAETFTCGRHALRTDYRNLLTRALELFRGTGSGEEGKTHVPLVSWSFSRWIDATKSISHREELKQQTRRIVQAISEDQDVETRARKVDPEAERVSKIRKGSECCCDSDLGPIAAEWCTYLRFSSWRCRTFNALPSFMILWIFAWIMVFGLDAPLSPHRGDLSYWFSVLNGMVVLAIPYALLLIGVLQETLLCATLIKRIGNLSGHWRIVEKHPDRTYANHLLTILFIARRTEATGNVVWYPLSVLLVILFSLSTRFDNYDTPGQVLGTLGLALVIATVPIYLLRNTARKARQRIIDQLKNEIFATRKKKAKTSGEKAEVMIERIEEIHDGAFRSWYQEPVVQALAWVLGIGAIIVTEYLTVSI